MDIVFILGTVLNGAILIAIWLVYRKVKNGIKAIFTDPDTRQPLTVAQTIDASAKIFVARAVEVLGMHDKAQGSANVRRSNAVDTAMATDLLSSSSPIGALLATQFPNLAKTLGKNPALAGYVIQKLQGMNLGGGGNGQAKHETPLDLNLKL